MRALFLYSDKSGKNKAIKYHDYIVTRLLEKYEVSSVKCPSLEVFETRIKTAKEKGYDVLVIAGGDGTFSRAVNVLAPLDEKDRPTLGYIPTGTINDAGKTLGIYHSIKKAVDIILKGHSIKVDIGKVNNSFFLFVLAIGRYSDISYVVSQKKKRRIGPLSYYLLAVKEAFKPKRVKATLIADGIRMEVVTPFVLIMNSLYVGGFPVNFSNSITDGQFDVYLTKPGLFNGLLHFLFFKVKTKHIRCSHLQVKTSESSPWCVDGEKGMKGDINIICLPHHLNVFVNPSFLAKVQRK